MTHVPMLGRPYRGEAVTDTVKRFTDLFGLFGYAFARIDQRPEIDRSNGQVVLTLVAERARKSATWLAEDVLRRSTPLPNAMRLKTP